jgi:protein gp37
MAKTKIEYLDSCWNFYSGCRNYEQGYCPLKRCWARGMSRFVDPSFTPHINPDRLREPIEQKHKPSRIGVCFMGDLFGDWVDPNMDLTPIFPCADEPLTLKEYVFDVINHCKHDRFIFLTKRPDRLSLWSPFPDNCHIGVSVTNMAQMVGAIYGLEEVAARVKFISFEPLLERIIFTGEDIRLLLKDISWVILGQQTPVKASTMPLVDWVGEIVHAADKARAAVFLKDNLETVIPSWEASEGYANLFRNGDGTLRQEYPEFTPEHIEKG